ncbi:hypothetical protein A2366_01485 [Candidatus Woesebacteria bacterium RIFOXYB1_FULL_33_9]|nr:MAG: hypothetical protein A2366_01485 [Candidatus Woesebacteria bacterium RIFOXYB1_FULL_33_9]
MNKGMKVVNSVRTAMNDLMPPIEIKASKRDLTISLGIAVSEKENDWYGALSIFGNIYKDNDGNPTNDERVKAGIWASQMLINLGRLKQATGILDGCSKLLAKINDDDLKLQLEAFVLEKRAWVSDYRGKPKMALKYLNDAKNLFDSLGAGLSDEFVESRSTVEHFLGRVNFELGNFDTAIIHFNIDLGNYKRGRKNGKPKSYGEAFNLEWLARCYAYKNEFQRSRELIDESIPFFEEESKLRGSRAIIAHYCLTNAEISLLDSKPTDAVYFANEALKLRETELPKFSKGKIEARFVLAIALYSSIPFVFKDLFDLN